MKKPLHPWVARIVAAMVFTLLGPATSHAVTYYDIAWTGSGGYSMTGAFSYDESSISDPLIDESDIDTLEIEAFLDGASQGTWSLADGLGSGAADFNFNFDTSDGTFPTGGNSTSGTGQQWNVSATDGIGFISGAEKQFLTINGGSFGTIPVADSTLVATPRTVPVPASVWLFGTGLLGLIGVARRKRTAL